jgi:RNA polymerase sigma-70 factor, ECF subfamily
MTTILYPTLPQNGMIMLMIKPDAKLIRGVLRNQPNELAHFQQVYFPKMLDFVALKVGDSRDIEEIAQSVITDAIYSLPSYSGQSSLLTWLKAIASHEIADFYRKKKLKEILFSFVPGLESIVNRALSAETALEEKELKERVLICLSLLNEGYRQILRLKYIDGLSTIEIARLVKAKSSKAVEMRLRRARAAFIYFWRNEKQTKKVITDFSERELFVLAQHLGFAPSPLPHASTDLD